MGAIILLATLVTLIGQSRRLPLQNIIAITILILGLTTAIELFAAKTGLPYGTNISVVFHGVKTIGGMTWPVPLVWLVLLLNARSVAKQIIRRRVSKYYGTGILLVASVLTTAGYFGILALARGVWFWNDLVGIFLTSAGIFICLTPWLIKKRPAGSDS